MPILGSGAGKRGQGKSPQVLGTGRGTRRTTSLAPQLLSGKRSSKRGMQILSSKKRGRRR